MEIEIRNETIFSRFVEQANHKGKKGTKVMLQVREVNTFQAPAIASRNDLIQIYRQIPGAMYCMSFPDFFVFF